MPPYNYDNHAAFKNPLFFNPLCGIEISMKPRHITVAIFLAFMIFSCASRPNTIPDDLTPAEIIQRAQEASDRNRLNTALQHYEAVLARFPSNIEFVIAAEYEIAFIHYKQRKYEEAKAGFHALLERYNTPDVELLPPQFRILSLRVLDTIAEIENRRRARTE